MSVLPLLHTGHWSVNMFVMTLLPPFHYSASILTDNLAHMATTKQDLKEGRQCFVQLPLPLAGIIHSVTTEKQILGSPSSSAKN